MQLSIVVPYYQHKAGILSRCLASICSQKMDMKMDIHVIIVDDASPWPAKEEVCATKFPDHVTIEIIERRNGGPGAARNTGLDRVPSKTDFVAFIDSDDTWRNDHILRAVKSLGDLYDLYFADNLQWEGLKNLDRTDFGASIKRGQWPSHATVKKVWTCSNFDIVPYAAKEFIAHTSAIVYRRSKFAACRFDEELRYSEDDLFFLDLLFSSEESCASTEAEVQLGLGENIFFASWSWDSENNLKRCCYQLIMHKKFIRRYQLSPEVHREEIRIIRTTRPVLVFFMARQLLKGRTVPFSLLQSLWKEDPLFFAGFPVNLTQAALQWVTGKIKGKPAFQQK